MKRSGIALLEAAVALAIIGVVAIGALEAFAAESRAAWRARRAVPAVAIASEQLARLQLADLRALQTLPDSLRAGRVRDGEVLYAWHAMVEPVRNEPQLYALRVNVQWDAGSYTLAARTFRDAAERAP